MRRILIVGAGQAGLQLALSLQQHGYDVTLMSDRTPEEIRSGYVTSTQCMFHTALGIERRLGLNFWDGQAPKIEVQGTTVGAPDGSMALNWYGRWTSPAQSVDQRLKMSTWMQTYTERGGNLVVHGVSVSDLDWYARNYDLVVVASGKGELITAFDRNAAESPFQQPQRALAVSYVHGLELRPEYGCVAVRLNLLPGKGELIVMPGLTLSGPCDILLFEAIPGGPLDVFEGVRDPREHFALMRRLIREHVPFEDVHAQNIELTDARGILSGRFTPTVRHPAAHLPGGGIALGMADVVVLNDPISGQGSNGAAKSAAIYLESILERGDEPFDEAWMQRTFDRYWQYAKSVVKLTNALLQPPPEHVMEMLAVAGEVQEVADRFANGVDNPPELENYLYDPEKMRAYLAEARARTEAGAGAGAAAAESGP